MTATIDPPSSETIARESNIHTVLRARSGWQPINLKELWNYRELLWFLTMRDVKVRYKQTALGALWAVIQPLFTMIVFTIFFGRLGGLQAQTSIPYPILTFTALLPWKLFENALTNAGNSLVGNQNLITKVYFPRLMIPAAGVLVGVVDFLIAFVILIALMAWYHIVPTSAILLLPLFILLAVTTAMAAGLWLSALNVEYRDIRYVIPFLAQIWMFTTPVAYPIDIVRTKLPAAWQSVYALNPMVGVVEGFKWALLGGRPPGMIILISSFVTILLLIGGLFYFRRMEKTFADVV